jgi:hypothetical protein
MGSTEWDSTRAIQTDETLNALRRRAQRDRTKSTRTPRREARRARFGTLPAPTRLAAMFTAAMHRPEPAPAPADDRVVVDYRTAGYTVDGNGALRRTTVRRGKRANQRPGATDERVA